MKKVIVSISLALISFSVGFFVSTLNKRDSVSGNVASDGMEIRQGGYTYINPLLECEIGEDIIGKHMQPFKYQIKEYVDKQSKVGKIHEIGVYFRDLNNGSWFGINEDDKFTPASLLKLPLLIAYYKKAEEDKNFLEQKISYSGDTFDQLVVQNVSPSAMLQQDTTYTIEDLIRKMIVYSDNHAMLLLFAQMNKDFYDSIYKDIGINVPDIQIPDNYMSVKEYADFFRILFNASYLSKELSDRALRLLAQVGFKQGIKAGIPKNIVVAHKFGERSIDGDIAKQFHDCGIVYYPNHPYLLCVMTRGEDINAQMHIIAKISNLVYQEVDKNLVLN